MKAPDIPHSPDAAPLDPHVVDGVYQPYPADTGGPDTASAARGLSPFGTPARRLSLPTSMRPDAYKPEPTSGTDYGDASYGQYRPTPGAPRGLHSSKRATDWRPAA